MTLLAPNMLWLLLALPLAVATYIILLQRRTKTAVRYANLGMVKSAMGKGQRIRRHVPPALFLVAIALLLVSLTRPSALITLPSQRETIILALDVSGSMRANDVDPLRITAAQAAAREFVKDQPSSARIGVVAFSSNAMTIQQPTLNHDDVVAAIDSLKPQRFTAVGSAILVGLQSIFPGAIFDPEANRRAQRAAALGEQPQPQEQTEFKPVAPGSYTSAVIILMTDGQTNVGADPVDAARIAAERGVRVFTVGFGSEKGGLVEFEGRSVYVKLDEATLKKVADITHASYYRAGTQAELSKIYKSLTTTLIMEKQKTELTAIFAGAAALMAVLAAVLSTLWIGRFT